MHVTNSSIALTPTQMQAFDTKCATWYFQYTQMPPNFPNQVIKAGHFYLSNRNDKDFNIGAILTLSTIIKHIMLSASEAKLSALYYGCKLAAPL
jgi:hypothetical protein